MLRMERATDRVHIFATDTAIADGEVMVMRNAFGKQLRIIDDAGQVVGSAMLTDVSHPEPAPPTPPTEEQWALAHARADICQPCDQNQGISICQEEKFQLANVKCKACGCGGLSLIHGKCPKDLWNIKE